MPLLWTVGEGFDIMDGYGGTIVFADEDGSEVWMENALMQSAEHLETTCACLDVICARLRAALEATTRMSACLKGRAVVILTVVDIGKRCNKCKIT